MKKAKKTNKTAIKIGTGLATVATVVVAGYYFYGSKNAKNHRKIASKWATDMKKEVIKEAKYLERISPKAFFAIVDKVAKTYKNARAIDPADIKRATNELKKNWETIKREIKNKKK